jgi:polygalacturonase
MKNFIPVCCLCLGAVVNLNSQVINIKDIGAIPDNQTINTKAIQNAIDSCYRIGGGTVYIPAGVFITGTVDLRSNVNLYLERGAELKGSADINDYRFYQAPNYNVPAHYGIIYAWKAENVSITGQGAINGNEEVFFDWQKAKMIEWGGVQYTRQKEDFRKVESGIGDGPVEPKERPRQMVIFSQCKNVLVRDIMLTKSPFWTLHFADCDGVIATGLKVWSSRLTPNSDGIDVTSCSNVLISDCDIRTGDDAIAVTGYDHHFELPGFHGIRHLSENINITNCNLQSSSSGIRIGWLDQNSVRNIHISNINITHSNRGIGIFLRDEGSLENITISQVNIETRLYTGDWWGNGEPIHISAVRGNPEAKLGQIKHVTLRDIRCTGESGILVYGSEESEIEDIQFIHVDFDFKKSALNEVAGGNIDLRGCYDADHQLFESDIAAFEACFVKNLSIDGMVIQWDNSVKESYFMNGMKIMKFDGLTLHDIHVDTSPANPGLKPISLIAGKGILTDFPTKSIEMQQVRK